MTLQLVLAVRTSNKSQLEEAILKLTKVLEDPDFDGGYIVYDPEEYKTSEVITAPLDARSRKVNGHSNHFSVARRTRYRSENGKKVAIPEVPNIPRVTNADVKAASYST